MENFNFKYTTFRLILEEQFVNVRNEPGYVPLMGTSVMMMMMVIMYLQVPLEGIPLSAE
jgi:hypothetical protein